MTQLIVQQPEASVLPLPYSADEETGAQRGRASVLAPQTVVQPPPLAMSSGRSDSSSPRLCPQPRGLALDGLTVGRAWVAPNSNHQALASVAAASLSHSGRRPAEQWCDVWCGVDLVEDLSSFINGFSHEAIESLKGPGGASLVPFHSPAFMAVLCRGRTCELGVCRGSSWIPVNVQPSHAMGVSA